MQLLILVAIALIVAVPLYLVLKPEQPITQVARASHLDYNEKTATQKELHILLDYWTFQRKICQSAEEIANVDRKRRAVIKQLTHVNTRA